MLTPHLPYACLTFGAEVSPADIFTERKKRLFLVVSKHLKDDRLSPDVVHKGFGHLNSNLQKTDGDKEGQIPAWLMSPTNASHILHMVEAKRRAAGRVLQRFGRKGLIMPMDEAEIKTQNAKESNKPRRVNRDDPGSLSSDGRPLT